MSSPFFSNIEQTLKIGNETYTYYSLKALEEKGFSEIPHLPRSIKILLENVLRRACRGEGGTQEEIEILAGWAKTEDKTEVSFRPARILMQDFTGVPAIVDLAAMRDALKSKGKSPDLINPMIPVDLIIDHSITVDRYGTDYAFNENVHLEFERNQERYSFLKWGQKSFKNFRVVPPGTGICHQVNLEYLSKVVWVEDGKNGSKIAYPDTVLGTDSHTTMVNGLSVLGWGVGGIEAEAALLSNPLSMLVPDVVGICLTGKLKPGVFATDLVLTITEILRKKGVVGKFVEYYGAGLQNLTLPDRATLANMAPEYGATCGFFPIDQETLNYLSFTGRPPDRIRLVEFYAKAQGLWQGEDEEHIVFSDTVTLDLSEIEASLAGPKRPQDRTPLRGVPQTFQTFLNEEGIQDFEIPGHEDLKLRQRSLRHGDVVIASITSCTNTSNPFVMVGAGLLAQKARARGLKVAPWVKTSLAPGSKVVMDYLKVLKLQDDLDALGFNLVGYGCTTCIGNSGPLSPQITREIEERKLLAAAVLSGNRNFEGRINPSVRASYLASPPLVVAYAIAGSMFVNLEVDALGLGLNGDPVYLKDIWPKAQEIQEMIQNSLKPEMFTSRYADIFRDGTSEWKGLDVKESETYAWPAKSTYIRKPPFLEGDLKPIEKINIEKARPLLILGDSVTTDHISPAGSIKTESPAGFYLREQGIEPQHFNSYGARRGNHEVMMRGTFANIRLKNKMLPESSGGVTLFFSNEQKLPEHMSVFEAAERYKKFKTPLIVIAGKEYGSGSSRDWAAKGPKLLGVQAIIAESFERIHRSNLVGMGILPLEFPMGVTTQTLGLVGNETFSLKGAKDGKIVPKMAVELTIHRINKDERLTLLCRIDTFSEVSYLEEGGILPFMLKEFT